MGWAAALISTFVALIVVCALSMISGTKRNRYSKKNHRMFLENGSRIPK